ncbi:MAG: RNA-binding S4 domain-containing protein [Thomasclavelia sp.]|nr:RNA-binding S4 domain-containing protein [Thomasclavelia sp.]
MKTIKIHSEFITLGQFLKFAGIVSDGNEAKMVINDGLCKVNNQVETRRGKKLYKNDQVEFNNEKYLIDEDK